MESMKVHTLYKKLEQIVMEGGGDFEIVVTDIRAGYQHDIEKVNPSRDQWTDKPIVELWYREG